jgi:hypothetical protein
LVAGYRGRNRGVERENGGSLTGGSAKEMWRGTVQCRGWQETGKDRRSRRSKKRGDQPEQCVDYDTANIRVLVKSFFSISAHWLYTYSTCKSFTKPSE